MFEISLIFSRYHPVNHIVGNLFDRNPEMFEYDWPAINYLINKSDRHERRHSWILSFVLKYEKERKNKQKK